MKRKRGKNERQATFGWTATGELVRNAREKLGLTQQDVADRVTCQRSTVNMVERGTHGIPGYRVRDWARALKLDAAALCEALYTDWLTR